VRQERGAMARKRIVGVGAVPACLAVVLLSLCLWGYAEGRAHVGPDLKHAGIVRQDDPLDSPADPLDKVDAATSGDGEDGAAPAEDRGDAPAAESEDAVDNDKLVRDFYLQFVSQDGAQTVNEVLGEGDLLGKFKKCTEALANSEDEALARENCVVIKSNAEHVYGEFFFMGQVSKYSFEVPTVTSNKPGLNPEIQDYAIDEEELEGSFSISFGCTAEAAGKLNPMSVRMKITPQTEVLVWLLKECGSGELKDLAMGYVNKVDEMVSFAQKKLVVDALSVSTTLYLMLATEGAQLEFKPPVANSSDPGIASVNLRGAAKGGVLSPDPAYIEVQYQCKMRGRVTISLTLSAPPYDPTSVEWGKDCGGGVNERLSVGTSAFGSDVVSAGETTEVFKMDYDQLSAQISRFMVSASESSVTFFINNAVGEDGEGMDMSLSKISLTRGKPNVLAAFVSPPLQGIFSGGADGTLSPSGGALPTGAMKTLRVSFVCKRAGSSNVLVTIPTLNYENIEFGFTKECRNPRKIKERSMLRTSNSLFMVIVFVTVAALAGVAYIRRKQLADRATILAGAST